MKLAAKAEVGFRLTTSQNGEYHITIPKHDPLKVGAFCAILNDVSKHFSIDRDDLIKRLFKAGDNTYCLHLTGVNLQSGVLYCLPG
jgi:hypothetical protein